MVNVDSLASIVACVATCGLVLSLRPRASRPRRAAMWTLIWIAVSGLSIGTTIVNAWRSERGLAWSDLTPLAWEVSRLERDGPAQFDFSSLRRRLSAGMIAPREAATIAHLCRGAGGAEKDAAVFLRFATDEAGIRAWLRETIPPTVESRPEPGRPSTMLVRFAAADDAVRQRAPYGRFEATLVGAEVDGSAAVIEPIRDERSTPLVRGEWRVFGPGLDQSPDETSKRVRLRFHLSRHVADERERDLNWPPPIIVEERIVEAELRRAEDGWAAPEGAWRLVD